ncbi:hypothetical protein QVZ41_12340 [Wenyingzhuangia sp. chi5]|uniref:Uncharacterized protein n=1 Tax=Wenyingzhuangia gilva TaxID=3057677 RepID=A0ABT8VUH7_9FLAO|nr:hypothetical protein [Wenyingzhuangia sp. chi5]MDO3695630.1 hypothetical protein [Wenyingzhuangia sp. chi5]
MKTEVENYINNTLSKIAILDEPNVAFEQVEILEYRTHYENDAIFTHQNGDNYALAILNAITKESYFQVSRALKKTKNLSIRNIEDLLDDHYLKCYIAGDSEEYAKWNSGDLGTAFLQVDEENKTITPHFINTTAQDRTQN